MPEIGAPMYRYILNRLLLAIPTLIGAAALVFILMRLIPGDICMVRLGGGGGSVAPRRSPTATPSSASSARCRCSSSTSSWASRRDFGVSMWSGKPVIEEIATRIPVSLEIAILATLVAVAIAIPLGTISALQQNSWLDHIVRTVAIAGIATPSFWLGIMSILIVLDVSQRCSARRGCRRSTTCLYGKTRCTTSRS